MINTDDNRLLLYIEPKAEQKSKEPVDDELVTVLNACLRSAKAGILKSNGTFHEGGAYKGTHTTDCGIRSTNQDYLLGNGMITNALCAFYMMYYRNAIPQSELLKVKKLYDWVFNIKDEAPEEAQQQTANYTYVVPKSEHFGEIAHIQEWLRQAKALKWKRKHIIDELQKMLDNTKREGYEFTKRLNLIKLSKEEIEFLKSSGTVVITAEDEEYYHLPLWYKKTNQEGVFEELNPNNPPRHLEEVLKKIHP